MIRRSLLLLPALVCALALAGPASAQLALPGAAPPSAPGSSAPAAKPKKTHKDGAGHAKSSAGKAAPLPAPGIEGVAGKPLRLNGQSGVLQLSGTSDALRIDTLKLAGEGVSAGAQPCEVDIVGETPIQATRVESPDGLAWYEAEVPACPFSFEVVTGAVRVPPQITACVFKAADCQTSPAGVWGPDGASLAPQADAIAKRRTAAEKAMGRALRGVEAKARDNSDAQSLLAEQKDFASQRDETCRGYDKEAIHGFCAAALTEARAGLLQARLASFGGGDKKAAANGEHHDHARKKKKPPAAPKPAEAAPQ